MYTIRHNNSSPRFDGDYPPAAIRLASPINSDRAQVDVSRLRDSAARSIACRSAGVSLIRRVFTLVSDALLRVFFMATV